MSTKSFASISELEDDTLMIVDALNLAFRWFHARDLDFLEAYHRTVESLRKSYKAGKVVLAVDLGSSAYRKQIFPEYKANRKEKYENQSAADAEFFELFFKEFREVMESFTESTHYPVIQFDKTEADDIAAYITKNRNKYNLNKVVLISSDRDCDLLVADNVMRFSYVTRKEITFDNWSDHYECTPDEYISIKCLQGDTGDNVPGVPKIGPKTALKLVKQYGSALDIVDNMPLTGKYVYIKNLNDFGADNIMRNYQLMDLITFCDEALGANTQEIDKIMKEYCNA